MNDPNIAKSLSEGRSYLLKIVQRCTFGTVDRPDETGDIQGEFRLRVTGVEKGRIGVSLPFFGLYGPGIPVKEGNSGRLSVRGLGGIGHIYQGDEQWRIEISFEAEVLYERVGRELGYVEITEDIFNSPVERFQGRLTGVVLVGREKRQPSGLSIADCRIHLVYQKGGLGLIRSLLIPVEKADFVELLAPSNTAPVFNTPCPPTHQVNVRTIRVQPVGFRSSATDANPTGTSANRQFNAANAIWGKCCIQFDVQPIHIITDATLKSSSNAGAIAGSYTDTNSNTIEVFFSADTLSSMGGGVTYNSGSALAKVVITDNNVGDDNLLAHELGHVLSGMHPGTAATAPLWVGDTNTVLVPTGSPTIANPDENTYWNCINAINPVMTTTTTACCLSHDIPDHYVRDFPEDLGAEPASAPPGRNFYSMSNVWNRLSNTPGGVTSDGQREHEPPVRYQSDGTPYQNYLFAKVEAIVDLPPRDMTVKFFLKHPGSGGGAANIQLLGSVPVPNTLNPGHPEIVSFAWQVPSGVPQHSCIFAVVRSPAEPDQDITTLAFQAVESLVQADNDWAQRNLDIADYAPGTPNQGNIQVWSTPIFIVNPFERGAKPLPVSIEIDASQAKRLVALNLESPGRERRQAKPGGITTFKLREPAKPGEFIPVAIGATLPANAKAGEIFTIDLNPKVGDTQVVGYRSQIRVNRPARVVRQVFDLALAAFEDCAELNGSETADELAELHRKALQDLPRSPLRFQKWFSGHLDLLQQLVKELSREERQCNLGIAEAFERLKKAVAGAKGLSAVACYRDTIARIQMLVFLMYQKARRA